MRSRKHIECVLQKSFFNNVFNRTPPVAASDSFKFPACNFTKKETPAKIFFCEFWEIFKNTFLTENRVTARVYLLILRSFSPNLFYRATPGNCLFHVQVTGFQPDIQLKTTSQILFKHFLQGRAVTTWRRSFT